ncbi:MAG: rod shape-determining protein RodA [Alphaproteobacteria bacterium CG1_02_46_17]|nr:MAG: rod shape-determining protein RodA [Alphaproteobacteria bacterium CG1_02_46_17]
MSLFQSHIHSDDMSILGRLKQLAWGQIILICVLACIGFLSLYSAAGGTIDPWASAQIIRFLFSLGLLLGIALLDIRLIFRSVWVLYGGTLILLLLVDIIGHVGMGAQRWLDLGIMKLQPSELAKVTTVMALARYYHGKELADVRKIKNLLVPAIIILMPVGLVVTQPDLGTGMAIIFAGTAMLFVVGVPYRLFIVGILGAVGAVPIAWQFLRDYQKNRVLTFLNPESDPLGAGFHITQSKIALGSGGFTGKGFLEGTQSHLNFLPEKHTDFIFTLWAEEWGFLGSIGLLTLLSLIILYGYWIAFRCRNHFARLLAFGLTVNFSIYVIVNIGMVMGLLPVVGIPLPLMSYGGTAMLTVMMAFGLIQSCNVHRDAKLPRGL